MGFFPKVGFLLALFLFLFSAVDGGSHIHQHRHNDMITAPTNSPLSLLASTVTPKAHGSFLQGSATPCTGSVCATAVPTSSSTICPAGNETTWTDFPTAQNYTVICDVDFPAQNIYPFVLASSFEDCMAQCEAYNAKSGGKDRCEGFVYAPERVQYSDDCYLKSSLDRPFPATIPLVGATRVASLSSTSSPVGKQSSTSVYAASKFLYTADVFHSATSLSESAPTLSSSGLSPPKVARSQLHGASVNNPTTQWVYHEPFTPMKLDDSLLKPGVNCDLITEFDLADDTGPLTSSSLPVGENLVDLSVIPHLSRDGGKGGELDGHRIFIFCDTASFTTTNETHKGDMVGFTSSSVAIEENRNGISGKPLSLVDGIGQWNDDVGRMRGYSPMTYGEESFNLALSGKGHRYAVWPMSSIIPLNKTHALQYASLVYDEVNMATQEANFTTMGNTLLTVSVDENYGPSAERTVKRLFDQGEVNWGTIGGVRSWGSEGIGGMDGKVYVFGQTPQGVLVARTEPDKAADRDSVRPAIVLIAYIHP